MEGVSAVVATLQSLPLASASRKHLRHCHSHQFHSQVQTLPGCPLRFLVDSKSFFDGLWLRDPFVGEPCIHHNACLPNDQQLQNLAIYVMIQKLECPGRVQGERGVWTCHGCFFHYGSGYHTVTEAHWCSTKMFIQCKRQHLMHIL